VLFPDPLVVEPQPEKVFQHPDFPEDAPSEVVVDLLVIDARLTVEPEVRRAGESEVKPRLNGPAEITIVVFFFVVAAVGGVVRVRRVRRGNHGHRQGHPESDRLGQVGRTHRALTSGR